MPDKTRVRWLNTMKIGGAAMGILTPVITLIVVFGGLPGRVTAIEGKLDTLTMWVGEIRGELKARGQVSGAVQHDDKSAIADAEQVHRAD